MKILKYIFAAGLLFVPGLYAQPPDTLWTSTPSGARNNWIEVIRTRDLGYAIGTAYWPEDGRHFDNALLIVTDSLGQSLRRNFYARNDSNNIQFETLARAIRQTEDGGFVLAGIEAGGGFVARTDANGTVSWMKNLPVDQYRMWTVYACELDHEGNIVVVGEDRAVKLDDQRQGEVIWSRSYNIGGGESISRIFRALEGGFLLTGSTTSIGAGSADMYIVKINNEGEVLWRRSFGTNKSEGCTGAVQAPDGGWCLVGDQSNGIGDSLFAMSVRITIDGDELWQKVYNQYRQGNFLNAVVQTSDSGFALAGYDGTASKFLLIRTDKNGEALWRGRYEGSRGSMDACTSLMLMDDGGYTLAGHTGHGVCLIRTKPDTTHTANDTNNVVADDLLPASVLISSIYPNPFNSSTNIRFGISKLTPTRLGIYGLDGRLIDEMY